VVKSMPRIKALSPDGYIGLFFRCCWEIIHHDLMRAIDQFYNLNQQGLQFLNQALVVLIPKWPNTVRVIDFRPISMIHSFAKILSKLLSIMLAPELKHLIAHNQNAFIKKCSIHDNFMLVSQMVRELYKKKTPAMFIKIDISKALDSMKWSYLIDIMVHLGFGPRWRS
jgi:hypothetical protein